MHKMSEIGDSFEVLKRRHVLVENDVIHIQQNPRLYEKLLEVAGITSKTTPKKTRCHVLMTEEENRNILMLPRPQHIVQLLAFLCTWLQTWLSVQLLARD